MGQMDKPLMDITAQDLQVEINSYTPGSGLAWAQLFPLKYTPTFDIKAIAGDEGIPVSADRVAFNVRAPKKKRKLVGSWSGQLGKISISRSKDEIEIAKYNQLKNNGAVNTTDTAARDYLIDLIYDDVKFCTNGMDYRVEVDALRIATSGKQVLTKEVDGDMATQDEINFNIPEDNFGGVTTKWDNAETADGLNDIAAMQKKIAKKGLSKPRYVFMSETAFERLCAQKSTIKKVASAALTITELATSDSVSLDSINAYQRKFGRPQIVVIESYVTIEDKDGNQNTIEPWNENVLVMSPVPRLGYTYYHTVPMVQATEAVQVYGNYYKVTRYSTVNPMEETTLAEAYVQPALSNRASLCLINTMNTSWNDGNE